MAPSISEGRNRRKDNKGKRSREREEGEPEVGRMKALCGFEPTDFSSWPRFRALMNQPRDPAGLGMWRILFGFLMMCDVFQERGMAYVDHRFADPSTCFFPLFDFIRPLSIDWIYVVYLAMLLGAAGMCLGLFYRGSCLLYAVTYWYIFLLDNPSGITTATSLVLLLSTEFSSMPTYAYYIHATHGVSGIEGAAGMCLGVFYRGSCLLYAVTYWYIFLLDKSIWNNHSYLFGLVALMMILMDANRFWSVDSIFDDSIRNRDVPLWNYALLKTQVFLVYFIAGLKKLDLDWVQGFSMENLSNSWVFDPFRFLGLSNAKIDFFIVHLGGLILDSTAGFLLFFDVTRPIGAFSVTSFHTMNSMLFHIGMFPYVMLVTTLIFFYPDWPKKLLQRFPRAIAARLPSLTPSLPSEHCLYQTRPTGKGATRSHDASQKSSPYHNMGALFFICYIIIQAVLPYSHFLTQGCNNWTNGLYGYSWDMMVHSWNVQHTKLKYVNNETGEEGFLSPDFWAQSKRWKTHADMVKQYTSCVSGHLEEMGIEKPALYLDVWLSMNSRFQQRMWDPHVDIVTADWSPFIATPWMMPLLTDLSDWREKLAQIETQLDLSIDVTFVADFPGLYLENFVDPHLGNTSLQVMNGDIVVQIGDTNTSLSVGDKMKLPAGEFHVVHTVSDTPSCYMYLYVNTTREALQRNVTEFLDRHNLTWNDTELTDKIYDLNLNLSDPEIRVIMQHVMASASRTIAHREVTAWHHIQASVQDKVAMVKGSFMRTWQALNHIVGGGKSVAALILDEMAADEEGEQEEVGDVSDIPPSDGPRDEL